MSPGREPGPAAARVALAAAWGVGALVRTYGLGAQAVVGDELHAFRAALTQDAAYLATHNHLPGSALDYSIPMALWNALLVRTVGLEEWGLRFFPLLAGVLLVPLLSLLAWRRFGRLEGIVVAWTFALAPVFVFYSRFARPYMVAAFCTSLALVAWLRWTRTQSWTTGATAALAGAIAIWFSLTAAPAVLAVQVLGLLLAARRAARPRWAAIVLLGLLATAALVGPSLAAQAAFLGRIGHRSAPTPATCLAAAQIAFGTRGSLVLAALLAATVAGAVVCCRRAPALAAAALLMLAAAIAAIAVLAPAGTHVPGILQRYTLAAWPGVLLLTCIGLCACARWLGARTRRPRLAVPAVAALLLAAVAASGPLPGELVRPHPDTSNMFRAAGATWSVDRARVPPFYRELAAHRDDVTIAELPPTPEWRYYQDLHRKRIKVVGETADGVRLRTATSLDRLLAGRSDVDYVVVHKQPVREWLHVTGREERVAVDPAAAEAARSGAVAMIAACRASAGLREVRDDAWVTVFARAAAR